jgi:hypothetical protein
MKAKLTLAIIAVLLFCAFPLSASADTDAPPVQAAVALVTGNFAHWDDVPTNVPLEKLGIDSQNWGEFLWVLDGIRTVGLEDWLDGDPQWMGLEDWLDGDPQWMGLEDWLDGDPQWMGLEDWLDGDPQWMREKVKSAKDIVD